MSKKSLIYIASVILLTAGIYAWYQYNRGHEDLAQADPDFSVQSEKLHEDFSLDETAANKLYLGKVVAVSGKIKSIQKNDPFTIVSLQASDMGDILCSMAKDKSFKAKEGDSITLIGECTGALGDTDLGMLDVNLVRCIKK